jgi:hypothetical protein
MLAELGTDSFLVFFLFGLGSMGWDLTGEVGGGSVRGGLGFDKQVSIGSFSIYDCDPPPILFLARFTDENCLEQNHTQFPPNQRQSSLSPGDHLNRQYGPFPLLPLDIPPAR